MRSNNCDVSWLRRRIIQGNVLFHFKIQSIFLLSCRGFRVLSDVLTGHFMSRYRERIGRHSNDVQSKQQQQSAPNFEILGIVDCSPLSPASQRDQSSTVVEYKATVYGSSLSQSRKKSMSAIDARAEASEMLLYIISLVWSRL
jgi:hypothetical protein